MRCMAYLLLAAGAVLPALAIDTMTLNSGKVLKGRFMGFADRKFEFKTAGGPVVSGFPVEVQSIIPEAPLAVTVDLANKRYKDAEFRSFDQYTLRLTVGDEAVDERVILLKRLVVNRPPEEVAPPPGPGPEPPASGAGVREWKREGNWREVESGNSRVISKGEVVDIENHLKKGCINVVHFHYPKSLTSVREGNYMEALASKASSRIVILKVLAMDFNAPICEALGVKSLPQFWFYDARGRLVKKLTDRFTEGDIDEALKLARRGVLQGGSGP